VTPGKLDELIARLRAHGKMDTMAWEAAAALEELKREKRWIPVGERLPTDETPVLIICRGHIRLGELRWEHPGFEDIYKAFRYWDDPNDDGQSWEWHDITHWQPLPKEPSDEQA